MKFFFLFAFFSLAIAPAIPAQSSSEQAILQAREKFSDIKSRSIELERMKRDADKQPVSANLPLKFPEIKEDFEQIQKLNSRLQDSTAAKTPLDRSAVLKFASEITERAARLRLNLFPLETKRKKDKENKQPLPVEPRDVKALLGVLDEAVNSFVHNPIFQNLNLVNLPDSLKAQQDLEAVIKVGKAIKVKAAN